MTSEVSDEQAGVSSATVPPPPSSGPGIRFAGVAAGIGSGLTKTAVGHGFDTIKTRLQCSPPGTYTGALDCLLKTVRNESVLALYKVRFDDQAIGNVLTFDPQGASPPAIGWAISDSILMGSLYNYRLWILQHGGSVLVEPTPGGPGVQAGVPRLTVIGHGLAGLWAGWTSAVISQPVELLKVNLQLQRQRSVADRQFKGPFDVARQVIRNRGVLGLYRGFATQLYFRGCFFWMFGSVEAYMRVFGRLGGTRFEMNTATATFLSGGLAAFSFWAFAIPVDNIKNRIMSNPLAAHRATAIQVARTIYATQGWRGFYAGFVPILLRAFPVNAAAYSVYEGIMRLLGAEKTRQ